MKEQLWKTCGLGILGNVGGGVGAGSGVNGLGRERPGRGGFRGSGSLLGDILDAEVLHSPRTQERTISDAVVCRNELVAKTDQKLLRAARDQEAARQVAQFTSERGSQSMGMGTPRSGSMGTPRSGSKDMRSFRSSRLVTGTQPGVVDTVVDSAALAAELDAVMADLKRLMSDSGEDRTRTKTISAELTAGKEDEDEDEPDRGLQERILQYRFVRRIEAPPPPLPRLEDFPPDPIMPKDKMDANLLPDRIRWNVPEVRKEAAGKQFQMAMQRRVEAARVRAEKFSEFSTQLRSDINAKMGGDKFHCKAWSGWIDKLTTNRTQREQRTKEARVRRVQVGQEREEKIRFHLAEKQARVSANRSQDSTK